MKRQSNENRSDTLEYCDLIFVATLKSMGFNPVDSYCPDHSDAVFYAFQLSPEIKELHREYLNGELRVEPRQWQEQYRAIRREVGIARANKWQK